jgi:hypothetical protein
MSSNKPEGSQPMAHVEQPPVDCGSRSDAPISEFVDREVRQSNEKEPIAPIEAIQDRGNIDALLGTLARVGVLAPSSVLFAQPIAEHRAVLAPSIDRQRRTAGEAILASDACAEAPCFVLEDTTYKGAKRSTIGVERRQARNQPNQELVVQIFCVAGGKF